MWIIGIVHTVYSYWQIQHAIAGELLENGSFRDYRRKSEINKVKSQVQYAKLHAIHVITWTFFK